MSSATLHLRQLGNSFVLTFTRQALNILVGLGFAILVPRMLGPKDYGIYSLVVLLPSMLVTFFNLGVGPATAYFVSSKEVRTEEAAKANLLLGGILCLVAVGTGSIVIFFGADVLFQGVPVILLVLGLCIVPVNLLTGLMNSMFQGVQDFKRFNIITLLPTLIALVIAFIGLCFFNGSVRTLIFANVTGFGAAFALCLWWLKGDLLATPAGEKYTYIKRCLSYGWKAHLSNILAFFNYRIDMFLLNMFLGPAAIGIYSVSVHIAERLWMVSQAVSTVVFPRIAELKSNETVRQQITPFITRWVLIITFGAAVIAALCAPWIIRLLFGVKFQQSAVVLQLLLPGILLGAGSRVLSNDIAARGRPELNTWVALLTVIINIAANILLIPRMGVNGAAVATTVSYSINAVIKVAIYSKLTGLTLGTILSFSEIEKSFLKTRAAASNTKKSVP